jgi:hypothetical protein
MYLNEYTYIPYIISLLNKKIKSHLPLLQHIHFLNLHHNDKNNLRYFFENEYIITVIYYYIFTFIIVIIVMKFKIIIIFPIKNKLTYL